VLGQIIFEQESRGQHLLPITFLRQLIRFYGDQMQAILPSYLESSLASFSQNQEQLREQMTRALSGGAIGMIEDQTRRNMEMFSEAMRMWMPFAAGGGAAGPGAPRNSGGEDAAKSAEARDKELESLRRQLAEMQKTLENIAGRK
jgi:polyhydroxyalkanoate synthesis regulator protein